MRQTKLRVFKTIAGLFLPVLLLAQGNPALNEETAAKLASGKYTVAILDFEGRGISQLESATLTDRLSSELANTNAVINNNKIHFLIIRSILIVIQYSMKSMIKFSCSRAHILQ